MVVKNGISRRAFLQNSAALAGGLMVGATGMRSVRAQNTITISHWQHHSAGRAATVEQFKTQFEEANPVVTIDFQSIPWAEYWGKLASGIAAGAGSAPDVFQIPMGLLEEYIAGGNIVPVNPSVISAADIESAYLPWTTRRAQKDGQYYGLPIDVQTLLVYRNNALFEEAGLDPAAPFVDHNDMFEQAVKLTKKTNGLMDQIGFDTSYYSAFQTILYQQYFQREQNGQPWIDPATNQLIWRDYPEILERFKWFVKLSAETDDNSFLAGQDRFVMGKAGMMLNHPVARGALKLQAPDLGYTIVPFAPRVAEQDPYTGGSHWAWVVGTWAADPELAWQWVHFCTNGDAQLVWNETGGDLPSITELVSDPKFRPDANANTVMDSLSYASPWEWVGWAEWVGEFNNARDLVVLGGETPENAFNLLVDNLNTVISQHTVNS
jgi:multiple sugar transport system substrate-binding protein